MNMRESVVAETLMRTSGRALLDIPSKVASRASHPKLVRFEYTNYKDERHTYVIKPESIEFAPYPDNGSRTAEYLGRDPVWLFHGEVVTRDGDTRPDMGTRRRTFVLNGIERLEILEQPPRRERATGPGRRVS